MIDRATVDRILDAAQIYEVVSDFVTLKKKGVNYVGLCPFHDDTTPSFYVSPAKGVCKCFACGKGGGPVHFIMEHEQMSYSEALRYLAKKYGIEVNERELTAEERAAQTERDSLFVVNQFARDYFVKTLRQDEEGRSVGMAYLRSRGIRDDIIEKFQLGYCPKSGHALADEARRKGYRAEFLVKTGLCYEREEDKSLRDRFWGRVIFPVHTLSGKVVAFGGRVLAAATKGVKSKYVNSPESLIYNKSNELYGIYFAKQAIVKQDRCYLVEGYTDVISMFQSGVENVVASSGTSLTLGQIRMIRRFTSNMTILYDGDAAGIKASLRGIDMLLEGGMNIKVCLLPDGDDPDSFARKHTASDFRDYITRHETDFIRFKIQLLVEEAGKDPVRRKELIDSVVNSISVIPEAIMRDVYIHECSQMLEVGEQLLVKEVAVRRERKAEHDAEQRQRERERAKRQAGGTETSAGGVGDLPSRQEAALPNAAPDGEAPVDASLASADAAQTYVPQEAPPPADSFIPSDAGGQSEFYGYERQLIQMIVRYGERVMAQVPDEETGESHPVTVIAYIASELHRDELAFHNALHRRILDEAEAHLSDEAFSASHYFLRHPDPEVSRICAELVSDRYQLSKYHSKGQKIVPDDERLHELVPQLMMSFKLAIVGEELKHLLRQLQDPAVTADARRCDEIMSRCAGLMQLQSLLAKNSGERIVLG